ncbi:hypothetical protein ACF8C6_13715 [Pseudomonas sp. zbq_18]|uniref:hypothetical protein n=1 Tax=Pseudomonas sp. zbq_18 TaxID=3367251 RepID=UPI00370C52E7
MLPTPDPDYEDPKEVYAFFGLAMYCANLFEASLINLTAAIHIDEAEVKTREEFDDTFIRMESKTLGQLLKSARSKASIPEFVDPLLTSALEKRNHLAHNFFRENAEKILHPQGRCLIIDELHSMIELFKETDKLITPIYLSLWEKHGVTEEFIESAIAQAHLDNIVKYGEL